MGSKLGIASLTDAEEAMLIKMWKYRFKIKNMMDNYGKAQSKATGNYSNRGFVKPLVALYTAAWDFMPDNYKTAMRNYKNRIANWIYSYVTKVLGKTITMDEASSAADKLISMAEETARKYGIDISVS